MLNFKKYGFVKTEEGSREYKDKEGHEQDGRYERKIDESHTLILRIFSNRVSLSLFFEGEEQIIADQYEIHAQKQFDFLIQNGRAAMLFWKKMPFIFAVIK